MKRERTREDEGGRRGGREREEREKKKRQRREKREKKKREKLANTGERAGTVLSRRVLGIVEALNRDSQYYLVWFLSSFRLPSYTMHRIIQSIIIS